MAAVSQTPISSDPKVSPLVSGYRWASSDLTYSFPVASLVYELNYGSGEPTNNFAPLNTMQQQAARAAFANYAAVANLTFTEVSLVTATIRLAMSDRPSTAWAYLPSTAPEGGDVWFNHSSGYYTAPARGNYAYTTFLHEIGHALGLDHPHENGMPIGSDAMAYTVMSYRSYVEAPLTGYVNENWGYAQSLMMYDIAALQHMYGANYTTNSGDTTYRWSPSTGEMSINGVGQGAPDANRIFTTVWDGGGTDTYNFSAYGTALHVDLRPGEWTTTSAIQLARLHYSGSEIAPGNIANALQYGTDPRSLIENAIGGSADDVITGNASNNALSGGRGNDRLSGREGNDRLDGGPAADRLDGGAGYDGAYYSSAPANDSLGTGLTVDLIYAHLNTGDAAGDTYLNIEFLVGSDHSDILRGTENSEAIYGQPGVDTILGRGGNDKLYGSDGNDRLEGGAGADRLEGGAGHDGAYYSSAPATGSSGTGLTVDLLYGYANTGDAAGDTYLNIEFLVGSDHSDILRGTETGDSIYGQTGHDKLYGRGMNDRLYASGGNDVLIGGVGADVLSGGAGNDRFYFGSVSDTITSAPDTISDFTRGADQMDLSAIDANTRTSGNQVFSYIGNNQFSSTPAELNFRSGMVCGDVDGDGIADFRIDVAGTAILTSDDFIL